MSELEYMILRGIAVALFVFAALVITLMDLRYSRIPNWAVLVILAAAGLSFIYSTSTDVIFRLICAGAVALLIISWQHGKIGAGDVKMMFASALFLNILCFAATLILAAILAAVFAAARKVKYIRYGVFFAPSAVAVVLLYTIIF